MVWDQYLADDYETFVNNMKVTLDKELKRQKIRANVTGRVKSEDSIKKSIARRKQGKSLDSLKDIIDGIHNLAGFRIIVQYPSGIP
ncbi:hypothetical protein BFJ63_vAg17128 [Fusarium oxysporum f. sp. narcissi]|uniref:Uncharacterized protein n=1 Tax=Fusarium oxysporum f. sp. narcissi TaxID=451672 RepID=A0A4Q2V7R9_FUSOX|nr:hypothetical protein BFJ63_vAg17128 [Fusarium oxysporum f. sp. narcissi]